MKLKWLIKVFLLHLFFKVHIYVYETGIDKLAYILHCL